MSDLLPCPFCGGTDVHTSPNGENYAYVYCNTCGAEGPTNDIGSVVMTWNRRAQPAQAVPLRQILTDPENQPNQYGVKFLMHGPKLAFRVGTQQFTLDYEPTEPGEFEFMCDALIRAFSVFTEAK